MTEPALSTGCFVHHEGRLGGADLQAVELASHSQPSLSQILKVLAKRTHIVGVHCPCPNRGVAVDLAAPRERRARLAQALHDTMRLAAAVHAEYIVVHAFYCFVEELPADDVERMAVLRRSAGALDGGIAEYRGSERYREAQQRARDNLKALLPELTRAYPRQRILLENLNPRMGYGGIWLDEVAEIARDLGDSVGICLDVGHLALSAAALELDMADTVRRTRDLIRTLHLHQNFAGRYFVDRHWNDPGPRPDLQEVDLHLPLLACGRVIEAASAVTVSPDNSAFVGLLEGAVRYAPSDGRTSIDGEGVIAGCVPVKCLLDCVAGFSRPVLELDSRYAPLADILGEYELARRREHPVLA
jgi:sugar phosphate isomerase/epimerase